MSNSKSDYKIVVCLETSKFWFVDDLYFHTKENNCLIEYFPNGSKSWFQNGKLHREDGPAVVRPNGTKFWYQKGERHREDGPAIEYSDGSKDWYQNGKRHRKDGPAVEGSNGSKFWYQNGKHHREDGPAIEYSLNILMIQNIGI